MRPVVHDGGDDGRQTAGQTPGKLAEVFAALPKARFCLDVSHALHAGGPDLLEALMSAFGERLAPQQQGVDEVALSWWLAQGGRVGRLGAEGQAQPRESGPMALVDPEGPADPEVVRLVDDGLELLSEEECLALLAASRVGRVAVTLGALPAVLPVNYGLLDGDIVFFTGEGTKLRAAVRNAVIAFEVDEIDHAREAGWSVLAVGVASEITDGEQLARARELGVRPWAGGNRDHLVGLRPEFLTGRRIAGPGARTKAPGAAPAVGGVTWPAATGRETP